MQALNLQHAEVKAITRYHETFALRFDGQQYVCGMNTRTGTEVRAFSDSSIFQKIGDDTDCRGILSRARRAKGRWIICRTKRAKHL